MYDVIIHHKIHEYLHNLWSQYREQTGQKGNARQLKARKKYEDDESEEDSEDAELKLEQDHRKLVNRQHLQNTFMQLRKICNHPFLFDTPASFEDDVSESIVNASGKMLLLRQLLEELLKRGHRVLIFSQMSQMLDLIADWLDFQTDWSHYRIDGSTKQDERVEMIRDFNNPNSSTHIFLLSTRAGGLGINLASADTVIFFDSDWNPQMDLQAQDRAHRIGQTKPVIVYRLVAAGTVEEKMLERAHAKRTLEKLVIHRGRFKNALDESRLLDEAELMDILRIDEKEDQRSMDQTLKDGAVLSDAALSILLDRSTASYTPASDYKQVNGSTAEFKLVQEISNPTSTLF